MLADPTSRTVPFGELPASDQGAEVLVIHPETPRIVRAPASTSADNYKRMSIELALDRSTVGAKGSARLEGRGAYGWGLHHQLLATPDGKRGGLFERWSALKEVAASKVEFDLDSLGDVRAHADVEVSRVGTRTADRIVFKPSAVLVTPGGRFVAKPRRHPVVISQGFVHETELRLALDRVELGTLPEDATINSPFGSYEQRWAKRDGALVVTSRLEQSAQLVPPERYDELRSFFEAITVARGVGVVLRTTSKEMP